MADEIQWSNQVWKVTLKRIRRETITLQIEYDKEEDAIAEAMAYVAAGEGIWDTKDDQTYVVDSVRA